MKLCITCRVEKPLTEYYRRKETGKLKNECKQCVGSRERARWQRLTPTQKQRRRAVVNAWRARNLDAVRKKSVENQRRMTHAMRGAYHNAPGEYTKQEWQDALNFYGNRCLRCDAPTPEVDHVLPLTRGGTNTISNLQPLCRSCNSTKYTHFVDYRTEFHLDW